MSPVVEPRSKGGFNLGDYVEVRDRIRLFYEAFPSGAIVTEAAWVSVDDDVPRIWVRAAAYRAPDDPHPGIGHSWMILPGTTSYTKGSELENTETSAWGRAIGATGIALDKSVASADEVRNKEGQTDRPGRDRPQLERTTHPENGLVGKVAVSGTQDFQLRETPEGWVLPFRLKDAPNRAGQIVMAHDAIAQALAPFRDTLIGQNVTVWGHYTDEVIPAKTPGGFEAGYTVLHLERIATPDFILPAPSSDTPLDTVSEPMWPDADEAAAIAAAELAEASA